MDLEKFIRNVPDFPKKGIQFKDITTLINNPEAFNEAVNWMESLFKSEKIDKVVAIESRGFIFGAPLALRLNAGLVLVRKKGKLPAATLSAQYKLEYGTDSLEMHSDLIEEGEKVVIVDDLLATGGTIAATIELLEKLKAEIVGISFLIELDGLNGGEKLKGHPSYSRMKLPCD